MIFPYPAFIDLMEKAFTIAEIGAAIKHQAPDGFSGLYYRKYSELLAPHLC